MVSELQKINLVATILQFYEITVVDVWTVFNHYEKCDTYCRSLSLILTLLFSHILSPLHSQKASATFRGKNKAGKLMEKGVAFPVCVSVNECVCHCSPLESDETVSSRYMY